MHPEAYGIMARPKEGPVTEFQPLKSFPAIPFELPFDWGADPYEDRTWRFRLHTLRNFVDKALAAGDFGYARDVFLDWKRWHDNCWWTWPLCFERATDQSWGDMATGIRASRLAYLLRSTDWQDERLIELAEEHAETLRDPAFVADNHNHAVTGDDGAFRADDGELIVDISVTSTCGQETTFAAVKGQVEPQIQGWASLTSRERHPRWALGAACAAQEASFIARFTLTNVGS